MSLLFPPLRKTLLQILGPSIVFIALSLSGGEMLLWPNLAANYGLRILWPIPIILFLQFIVNIEIERYTLVTGKSVESSLVAKTRWLAIIFAGTVLAALVWPAWMTTAGNLLALMLGFEGESMTHVGLVFAILGLLVTVLLFRRKSTYAALEAASKIGLGATLAIIFIVIVLRFDAPAFFEGLKGLFAWGYVPADMPRFDFVAALAYGGVAGVLNLVQSEWIKDKGYGVNSLKSPELVELSSDASQANYRRWFKLINLEHFWIFGVTNLITIFILAYLGTLLLPLGSAQGFQVLAGEVAALNNFLPALGTLFAGAGIVVFFMANVTVLDAIGRLVYRMLEPFRQPTSTLSAKRISEIAVYVGVAILASSLFIPSIKQPFILLVISASLSAFSMWLYAPLLIKLNASLPKAARPSIFRITIVLLAAAVYGLVTLWALSDYLPAWVVVSLGVVITVYHIYELTHIKPT